MRYHNRTMTRRSRHYNQGVALITAMLIVALATIAAVAVAARQQFDIRRSANLMNGEQSYQYALGVESWAVQLLTRDRKQNTTDTLQEDWAKQLPPLSVEGGQVAGHIEDLQGRYNLNNVVDGTGIATSLTVKPLQRLLQALDIPPELAWAVADWIDTDINASINGGAEDDVYTRLQPAYRTANTRMGSSSELLLINGFKPEYYVKLEPYVCALPEHTKINVNTASAPVLVTLSDNLSLSAAQAVVDARKDNPFADIAAFTSALKTSGGLSADALSGIDVSAIDVGSSYFLVTADTLFGKGRTRLFSEVHRANAQTSVILRAQGVL
jgi:general secretion pathway protein K